ncbi:hypothetical protein EMPG_09546, partial [Blastomyces silverae]
FRCFDQNSDHCLYHISLSKQIETIRSSASAVDTILSNTLMMNSYYINCCSKKEKNSDHIINQVKLKDTEEDNNNLLDLDFSLDSD